MANVVAPVLFADVFCSCLCAVEWLCRLLSLERRDMMARRFSDDDMSRRTACICQTLRALSSLPDRQRNTHPRTLLPVRKSEFEMIPRGYIKDHLVRASILHPTDLVVLVVSLSRLSLFAFFSPFPIFTLSGRPVSTPSPSSVRLQSETIPSSRQFLLRG